MLICCRVPHQTSTPLTGATAPAATSAAGMFAPSAAWLWGTPGGAIGALPAHPTKSSAPRSSTEAPRNSPRYFMPQKRRRAAALTPNVDARAPSWKDALSAWLRIATY